MSTKHMRHEREFILEQLKIEIAQELGMRLPQDGYYGHLTSYETGKLGGHITKRLAQLGEQTLSNNM